MTMHTSADPVRRRSKPIHGTKLRKLFQFKYVLLYPAGIYFVTTGTYFLYWLVRTSFLQMTARTIRDPPFVGFANYSRVLNSSTLRTAFGNTVLYYVLISVTLQILLGFCLALLFNKLTMGRAQGWVLAVLFIPAMMAQYGVALIWNLLLNTELGLLNQIARSLGMEGQRWLGNPQGAVFATIMVNVWQFTPFVFIIMLGGLQTLPNEPYEAATVDGASALQKLLLITLPLMKPIFLIAIVFRVTDGFRLFDLVWGMTRGGPGTSTQTLTMTLYKEAFEMYDLGSASVVGVLLLFVIAIFASGLLKLLYSEAQE